MLSTEEIIALESQYTSGVSNQQPIVLVRGEGARVWDSEGKEYIDCIGGHGVANVGHAHPVVAKAIADQAQRLLTAPNGFYNDMRGRAMAALVRIAPPGMERVFLCNSGTESVEAAFKFARIQTKRTKIISTMRGFHGRTMGALSATWTKQYRVPFEPLVPGFTFVPYGKLDRMDKVLDDETAAVILEVVQGEGGVNPGTGEYLRGVAELCKERGALFIADEVQTGFGRTGKMFACEHYDLRPDMMTCAKAVAGGVPMGAVLLGERVGAIPKRVHNSTFGGNPLACAAALATIDVLESEKLPQRSAELGAGLMAGLQAIESPLIREVRGLGLMVGVELKTKSGKYLAALAEKGVLALPAGGNVIRYLPPLVISEDDIDAVIAATIAVLTA